MNYEPQKSKGGVTQKDSTEVHERGPLLSMKLINAITIQISYLLPAMEIIVLSNIFV